MKTGINQASPDATPRTEITELETSNRLLRLINEAHRLYIRQTGGEILFDGLLSQIIEYTGVHAGMLARIETDLNNGPTWVGLSAVGYHWNESGQSLLPAGEVSLAECELLESTLRRLANLPGSRPVETTLATAATSPGQADRYIQVLPLMHESRLVGALSLTRIAEPFEAGFVESLQPLLECYGLLLDSQAEDELWYRQQDELTERGNQLEDLAEARWAHIEQQASILEKIHNAVISVNGNGCIVSWNRGAQRTFGYPAKAVLGKHLSLLLDAGDEQTPSAQHDQLFTYPGKQEFDLPLKRADGEVFFAHVSRSVISTGPAFDRSLVFHIIDMSEEKVALSQVEESEKRYRTLFDLSPNAIITLHNRDLIDCNQAALAMFGISSKKNLLALNFFDLSPPLQADNEPTAHAATRHWEDCLADGKHTFDWIHQRANGECFDCEVSLQSIEFSGFPVIQAVIRDVSLRKKNEATLRASELSLRQQERMLQQILDHLPVALFSKDINNDYRYTLVNPKNEELFGLSAEEKLGRTDFELTDRESAMRYRREDEELTRNNRILDIPEELFVTNTGEHLYVHTIKLAIPDEQGNPSQILGICEDITERRETERALHASERRFRELAANAPVGIFLTDPRGACIYVNGHWQKMSGLNQEQAAGSGWQIALHEDDKQAMLEDWTHFINGESDYEHEYRFARPDGSVAWVSSTAVSFKNDSGQAIGFLGCVTDITQRKQFERELQISRDEAQRANAAKTEFLSRMSHELRTPLNAILGFSQLIQLNEENLTPDQKEGIKHIFSGGEHLLQLIEDVLDFSRIDTGHMNLNLQRVSVNQILTRSVSMVGPLTEQLGIQIIQPETAVPDVVADPRRLQQVLVNLLSNAIKYNRRGGIVTLSSQHLRNGRVRITVADTGIGIRSSDQAGIFEPFERVSDPNNMVEGTGIGLSICKKLVELMGGEIDFASEQDQGSEFWVDLAAVTRTHSDDSADEDPVATIQASELENVRILYVDDHSASIKLMTEIARRIPGCEFISAANAPDGVALAKSNQPDLILMDINLPGPGGFEALEMLKGDERTLHIPVIALSANAMPSVIEQGVQSGFVDFLTKPLLLDSLFQAIYSVHCSAKQPQQETDR